MCQNNRWFFAFFETENLMAFFSIFIGLALSFLALLYIKSSRNRLLLSALMGATAVIVGIYDFKNYIGANTEMGISIFIHFPFGVMLGCILAVILTVVQMAYAVMRST